MRSAKEVLKSLVEGKVLTDTTPPVKAGDQSAPPKLPELVRTIGLTKYVEDGKQGYRCVVVTLVDGEVSDVEYLEPAWTENQAINIATGWIDNDFYRG